MELSYVLNPVYDSHKSFYGKANVVIADGISTLYSYDTPVATIGPRFTLRRYPTLFGPWDRLTGETLDAAIEPDPHSQLDLTDKDREAVRQAMLARLTVEVERLLEPYEAWLLGNGDIVGPAESRDEFMEDIEDIREQIRMTGVS